MSDDAKFSQAYRALNAQMHVANPRYGAGGARFADTTLKLAHALGTTSVLDYGCGKGTLAQAIPFPIKEYDPAVPGKDDVAQPADIVICTDVLEHVEPDKLHAVLRDLQRCVLQVAYLVIHMGRSQKSLPDGRNAHLIQENCEWWTTTLSQYFVVDYVWERTDEPIVHFLVLNETLDRPPTLPTLDAALS